VGWRGGGGCSRRRRRGRGGVLLSFLQNLVSSWSFGGGFPIAAASIPLLPGMVDAETTMELFFTGLQEVNVTRSVDGVS
jgi:hypothetical protein